MKKFTSYIPVLVVLVILVLISILMCWPQGQVNGNAQNGILDLRGKDLENTAYIINGEWDFYYSELLLPSDFTSNIEDSETIYVPSSWDEKGYPVGGYATYRMVLQTGQNQPLMLFTPRFSGAYTLWINGEIAHKTGVLSTNPTENKIRYSTVLLPVQPKNGEIELVSQVGNYEVLQSGIISAPIVGTANAMLTAFFLPRIIYCIVLGFFAMAAFYHLAIYVFRRGKMVYLLFSILCTLCFCRSFMERGGISEFFHWFVSGEFDMRLYMVLYCAHSIAIALFALYVFNKDFLKKYKYQVIFYTVFELTLYIFAPLNQPYTLLTNTLVIVAPLVFAVIIAAKSVVLHENKWTRLYFVALIFYLIIGTSTKFIEEPSLFMPSLLTNIFMIMAQSLVLSKDYANAFRLVEETNENLEQIVDKRTKDIKTTTNAMKELISNISHDLKTPLSVMSINLEKLSELSQNMDDREYQKHVSIAYHRNLDLQRLLQNLFEVSRIETGQTVYALQPVEIADLLAKAQEKYGDFLETEGIAFDISFDENAEISVDPQKIWSVFDNIIYNAVRYTKKGGTINIMAKSEELNLIVTIKDSGGGIAPEHLEHVFERFYKASTEKETENNSGIGLYIVKTMMNAMGGDVIAESEVGVGTAIVLRFKYKKSMSTTYTLYKK